MAIQLGLLGMGISIRMQKRPTCHFRRENIFRIYFYANHFVYGNDVRARKHKLEIGTQRGLAAFPVPRRWLSHIVNSAAKPACRHAVLHGGRFSRDDVFESAVASLAGLIMTSRRSRAFVSVFWGGLFACYYIGRGVPAGLENRVWAPSVRTRRGVRHR